jgi:tetratricopeptide (TPR) repeat protein
MSITYADAVTFVQHLAPTWVKTQHTILAQVQSLAVSVQCGHRTQEAISLSALGDLYGEIGRLEEAVTFYRRAAEIYATRRDRVDEARTRKKIAGTLVKLGCYGEARTEILSAVACAETYAHSALPQMGEPWKAWRIRQTVEQALGDVAAARHAWQHARQLSGGAAAAVACSEWPRAPLRPDSAKPAVGRLDGRQAGQSRSRQRGLPAAIPRCLAGHRGRLA